MNEDAARAALDTFAAQWGKKYPASLAAWERAWERFIPFLAFGPATRKAIYTTNAIESLSYQLRKITKNRGYFPSDTVAVKLLWLAITNIEDKRASEPCKPVFPPKTTLLRVSSSKGVVCKAGRKSSVNWPFRYPDRFPRLLTPTIYTKNLTGSTEAVLETFE